MAASEGWLRRLGIELQLSEAGPQLGAATEVEAGRAEVAICGPADLVGSRARGAAITGFARFLHANGGVMFLAQSGIRRPRQMAAKRIQYPRAPEPAGLAIVQTMIEADGGRCDPAQFTPVNYGLRHVDALVEGRAEVAGPVYYNLEVVEARARGARAGYFALKDWGVPDFCQLLLVTSEDTLFERRSQLERLVLVLRRGIDFVLERPREAFEIYTRASGEDARSAVTARLFEATAPCFTYDLSMSHDSYARLGHWLRETGQIARVPDRFGYWTNELVI